MDELVFLTPDEVIDLHSIAVDLFGGEEGLRDRNLLESAVFAPQQTFDGEYLYRSIYEMAAALWHGIVANHPFVDGNKRCGVLSADVFLLSNGIEMSLSNAEVVDLTLAIATGSLDRKVLADHIARSSKLVRPYRGT